MKYSFDSKLERANQHLKTLEGQIDAWIESKPYVIAAKFNAERGLYVVTMKWTATPPEVRTLIGDCLFNLRGCLDHLVYELAVAENHGDLTDDIARTTAFPILDAPEKFQSRGKNQIARIPPDAQTFIESLQPYHAEERFDAVWLWQLEQLHNIDKHRRLLIAGASHRGSMFRQVPPVTMPQSASLKVHFFRYIGDVQMFEDEAEIAEYGFAPGEPHVEVDFTPTVFVSFAERAAVERKRGLCRRHIGGDSRFHRSNNHSATSEVSRLIDRSSCFGTSSSSCTCPLRRGVVGFDGLEGATVDEPEIGSRVALFEWPMGDCLGLPANRAQ